MTKVRVYWNLHKKMWSVQDTKTNKVIGHKQHITLWNAKFVVRKGGQKRVREQGKKNVHAFAVGRITNDIQQVYDSWETPYTDDYFMYKNIGNILNWNRVMYNPYTDDYFVYSRNDYNEWNEVPRDFEGFIHMESLEHEHGIVPRVYV